MYKKFRNDLETGQKYEVLAQEQTMKYLENKYHLIAVYDDYKYDFQLSNGLFYEVKYERLSLKTNNIFIEFEAFNKSSGINKTLADYYIIILPIDDDNNQFLMIDVDVIKQLINDEQYKRIHQDKFKAGYIFDKKMIINNGLLI